MDEEREPKTHELKTHSKAFDAIWFGEKTYEIRVADRDFRVGDRLFLREWDLDKKDYTDRCLIATVTYMTLPGEWGLPEDLCVMALGPRTFLIKDEISKPVPKTVTESQDYPLDFRRWSKEGVFARGCACEDDASCTCVTG